MGGLTYLMVENPLGAIGMKVTGLVEPTRSNVATLLTPLKHVSGNERELTSLAPSRKGNRYVNRARQIDGNIGARTLAADTVENRDTLIKLFAKAKTNPSLRVAMPSSLRSGPRYFSVYCNANTEDWCHTTILYGHGSPGEINLGLGKLSIGRRLAHHEEESADRNAAREAFGLDDRHGGTKRIRALATHNLAEWIAEFGNAGICAPDSGPNGFFALLLMGCNVGSGITGEMATSLSDAIGCKTIIAAPTDSVTEGHLIYLLENLQAVRTSVGAGKIVHLYTAGQEDQVELRYVSSTD